MLKENIKVDRENGFSAISINPKVYSLNNIYSAAYVFLDKAYVIIDEGSEGKIIVCLKPKENQDLEKLSMDFYNELLSHVNYSKNVKENNDIIKMIVQRALISADISLSQEMEDKEIEEIIKELEKEEDEDIKEINKEFNDDKEE